MIAKSVSYKRHRFPPEIIARAVWLYFRFPLSLRLVEEMLRERGIVVSYETIRRWARTFGPDYAKRFRRKPARPDDIWHLDEVVITIAGRMSIGVGTGPQIGFQSGPHRMRRTISPSELVGVAQTG